MRSNTCTLSEIKWCIEPNDVRFLFLLLKIIIIFIVKSIMKLIVETLSFMLSVQMKSKRNKTKDKYELDENITIDKRNRER